MIILIITGIFIINDFFLGEKSFFQITNTSPYENQKENRKPYSYTDNEKFFTCNLLHKNCNILPFQKFLGVISEIQFTQYIGYQKDNLSLDDLSQMSKIITTYFPDNAPLYMLLVSLMNKNRDNDEQKIILDRLTTMAKKRFCNQEKIIDIQNKSLTKIYQTLLISPEKKISFCDNNDRFIHSAFVYEYILGHPGSAEEILKIILHDPTTPRGIRASIRLKQSQQSTTYKKALGLFFERYLSQQRKTVNHNNPSLKEGIIEYRTLLTQQQKKLPTVVNQAEECLTITDGSHYLGDLPDIECLLLYYGSQKNIEKETEKMINEI